MRTPWRASGVCLGVAASWLVSACGHPTEPRGGGDEQTPAPVRDEAPRVAASVGGDVIATVDGAPIALAEVERVSRELGISPHRALVRLEEELVLAHRAERSAVASDPEIERAGRRAAVRELLARVIEPESTPAQVTEAELEARRGALSDALTSPETRRASHLLVPLESDAPQERRDAAMRLARRIHDEVATETDPAAALDRHAGAEGAFELTVEHMDPLRQSQLDAGGGDPLFAAPSLGVLPDVLASAYGLHVVVLEEILPPWEVPREEWEPVLRRQIANERRAQALEALARELSERHPIHVDARAADVAEHVPLGRAPNGAP